MLLIYIKEVRKHLHKINNCTNQVTVHVVKGDLRDQYDVPCAVENLCLDCQMLLADLLEWGIIEDYYEQLNDRAGSDGNIPNRDDALDSTDKLSTETDSIDVPALQKRSTED